MHRYPLPLIAIAVAAGMFGSWACELPGWIWSSVFATFAVSALVLRRYANLSALSVLASCFALGGTLHHQRLTEPPSADHLVRLVGKPLVSVVFTIDERRRRDDGVELSVRASARYHAGHLLAARGRFRLFVPTRFRPHGQPLVPGSHWVARLRFYPLPTASNPGQRDLWAKRRIADRMVLAKLLGPPSRLSGDSSALLARTRERLLEKLDRLEAGPAAFWSAVLLGRRDGLSDRDRAAFARTGTAHLLAISGLHLGLVASWLFVLLRLLFGLGRRFAERVPPARSAALLTLPIVWCYALLSGLQPSTLRAALMISLYLGALLLGRRPSGVQSLSFAVITSLVSEPLLVQSVAFQLSVVAVAALLYGASNANRERRGVGSMGDGGGWARWRRVAMTSLRASSAASLGTLPIAWFTFYRLTPVAPLDNLLAIPMVSLLLMPLGMLWLLVALLPFGLERYLTTPMNLGSDALNALIRGLDRLPLSWPTRAPSLASLVALSVSCLAAIALLRGTSTTPRRLRLVVALGLLTTTAVHCWPTLESLVRPRLRVTALAVGQGDALLVEFPDGRTMLIDGGGAYRRASDPGRRVILPFLRYRGIRRIDILVLSHRDWDHLGGLFAVAENLPVGELWFNGRNTTSPGLRRFLRLLRARGVAIKVMLPDSATGSGTRRSREIAGVKVQLLQPREGDQLSGPNSLSLTLRLVFGRVSFLFPGDIERDGEELLLARHPTLRASVLKVPHHGSNTSSHRRFLEQIKPRIALFCVGRGNRFGFPRPEIWRRYGRIGARRMRTDRDGAIVVTTDGERIKLDWFRRDRVVRYPALWNPNAERSDHGH